MSHSHRPCQFVSPEDTDSRVRAAVTKYGWFNLSVGPGEGDPPYSYTIGLTRRYAHPELVIAGVDSHDAHHLFNHAVGRIAAGTVLRKQQRYPADILGTPVLARAVNLHACHVSFTFSDRFYGHGVRRLQLLLADDDGLFPGDPLYDGEYLLMQAIGG